VNNAAPASGVLIGGVDGDTHGSTSEIHNVQKYLVGSTPTLSNRLPHGSRKAPEKNSEGRAHYVFQWSESMLVLSRIVDQKIIITAPDGTLITLMVVEVRGDKVRIGVDAPRTWTIHREEIQSRVNAGVPPAA